MVRDMRARGVVAQAAQHHQEVCGLKWSPTRPMLASGGNDNQV